MKPLILLLCAFCALSSVSAQTNPPVAACGMPLEGEIQTSVTYSLSGDCALTDKLNIDYSGTVVTVTINGNGHAITLPSVSTAIGIHDNSILNLNQVTIDGAEDTNILVGFEGGTLNASQVTFRNSAGLMLNVVSGSLNNSLLEWNSSEAFALGSNGSTALVKSGHTLTLNNVVARNNLFGSGAISVSSGGSLTATGCLTLSGNMPYDVYVRDGGAWTDSSTGPCSGEIGNGDQAVIATPLMACGFPAAGNLDVSATYILSADCELSGAYYISEDVSISVIGNARTMRASRSGYSFYTAVTSSMRLENIALEGVRFFNWGDLRAEQIKVTNTVNGMVYNLGEIRFQDAVFEELSATNPATRSVAIAYNGYENGFSSFTDASFIGNTGGLGVLATWGAVIELSGCIHFENNSPVDTHIYAGRGGVVNDNRDPDCDSPIVDPLIPPPPRARLAVASQPASPPEVKCNPHCDLPTPPTPKLEECDIRLGAIGAVCRSRTQPAAATVLGVGPDSKGIFLFGLTQAKVEAAQAGIVGCSEDGRAAVRIGLPEELRQIFSQDPNYREELKVARKYIVISEGPTDEGKVHHVVLDNSLDGHVFGTVDTFGGPPGADCIPAFSLADTVEKPAEPTAAEVRLAPKVLPQPAQPDGSIMHIVQPGDTTSAISIAYRVSQREIIAQNDLSGTGDLITVGQELLIRAAED